MNKNKLPQVMTIPQASKLLKDNGIDIGETRLRIWCRDGTLPCVKAGRKTLVNYDLIIQVLSTGGRDNG